MAQTMPLGISEFREVRERGSFYIDKTRLITEVISDHSKVILLPRPRRFGKTLNLTMLREFFDDQIDNRQLFQGLAVCGDPESMIHLGAFPVIYITFKDLKPLSWDSCLIKINDMVAEMFKQHRQRLLSAQLYPDERQLVETYISGKASLEQCQKALATLTQLLQRIAQKRVVLLIDEYDSPIHAGYQHDFRKEIVAFMRDFLSGGFKDNPALEKGVLTGILRVAKDSIFSGLNNISVYTILDRPFCAHFGFTEAEVKDMLADAGMAQREQDVQHWYNGYRFGGLTLYNPWSLLSFFRDPNAAFTAHWIHTANNTMIRDLVVEERAISLAELTTLLEGRAVVRLIDPFVALNDLKPESVWGLLLLSGYLTLAEDQPRQPMHYALRIPNAEVRSFFAATVSHWLGQPSHSDALMRSLLTEDLPQFKKLLAATLVQVLSYHDSAGNDSERVFHVFLAGLMVHLSASHHVRSNRESGSGRYDLMLIPKQTHQSGFIFEFKKSKARQLEATARKALAQIEQNDYAAELRARGVTRIRKLGLAFEGKNIALASEVWELPAETHMPQLKPPLLSRFSAKEQTPALVLERLSSILRHPCWQRLLPLFPDSQMGSHRTIDPTTLARDWLLAPFIEVPGKLIRILSEVDPTLMPEVRTAWEECRQILGWLMLPLVDEHLADQMDSGPEPDKIIRIPVKTLLGVELLISWLDRRSPQLEMEKGSFASPYALVPSMEDALSPNQYLDLLARKICTLAQIKQPKNIDEATLHMVNSILSSLKQIKKAPYLLLDPEDGDHELKTEAHLTLINEYLPELTQVAINRNNGQRLLKIEEHALIGSFYVFMRELEQWRLKHPEQGNSQVTNG